MSDPKLPEAHLWLGRVSGSLLAYGWSSDRAADPREGAEAALKAVQLDEQNPYAHYAVAVTSVFAGSLERAIRAAVESLGRRLSSIALWRFPTIELHRDLPSLFTAQ